MIKYKTILSCLNILYFINNIFYYYMNKSLELSTFIKFLYSTYF